MYECCGLLKHVLKPYDNRSNRHFDVVEIVYNLSMTQAACTLKIACDNCRQKLYHVNQPLYKVSMRRGLIVFVSKALSNLVELDLSHNKISSLGSNLNTKLGNIKKINLAGNQLDSVEGMVYTVVCVSLVLIVMV